MQKDAGNSSLFVCFALLQIWQIVLEHKCIYKPKCVCLPVLSLKFEKNKRNKKNNCVNLRIIDM